MKKYLLIFTVFFTSHTYAQVNLVRNPSFEDTVSCPTGPGQINKALEWHILITGGGGNPELYHTCCNPALYCGVPLNYTNFGYQYPKSGNAYAGLDVANCNYLLREYIQSKLHDKLKSENTYCVKFFTNLSNYSLAYIKSLGVYFDNGDIFTTTSLGLPYANAFLLPVIPQILNTYQPLNDTLNWMKIEASFIATGLEEYITLGNFFPDSTSDIVLIGTPSYWTSYYYIDDVSVIDANLPAYAGNDTLIQPGDSVFIGRQPEIGLDEDCIWFVNGVPIDTVAGLWVKPDSTTTYIVQQTICGNVKWDTVTVSVDTGVGINKYLRNKNFNLYPNPNTGNMTLDYMLEKNESGIMVINDIAGRRVAEYTLNANSNSVEINENRLKNGIYYYSIFVNGVLVKTNRIVIIK